MSLDPLLRAAGLALVVLLVVLVRRLLRERTLEDPRFGTITLDPVGGWRVRRRIEAASSKVEIYLGGDKKSPPGAAQHAFLDELESRYPEFLGALLPRLKDTAAALAGERERGSRDFVLRELAFPDPEDEERTWWILLRSPVDGLDIELEMTDWRLDEIDAYPIDRIEEGGGEVSEFLPEHRAGDGRDRVASRGIVRLPAPRYTAVLTRERAIRGFLLRSLPAISLVLAFLLPLFWLGGTSGATWREWYASFTPGASLGFSSTCVLMLYGLLSIFLDLDGPANRDLEPRARRILGRRRDRLVDPDDSAAHFVELVLREFRHRQKLEAASDVGFLRVDPARRLVLYEGGVERWAIRGRDIAGCHVEKEQTGFLVQYFVVLEVRTAAVGVKERSISKRRGGRALLGYLGGAWARNLAASIDQIRFGDLKL